MSVPMRPLHPRREGTNPPAALYANLLNTAEGFWNAYRQAPGALRRKALLTLFAQHPQARLPVNNKWEASSQDPDLRRLLKQGVLRQVRDGGSRRHPLNRTSRKRQTYLVLA